MSNEYMGPLGIRGVLCKNLVPYLKNRFGAFVTGHRNFMESG